MRRHAFTLIELLTTIAIIAILVAMLMPVMLKAKGKVFQFTASSSARQLGMALNLYLSEADSYFPIPHWAGPDDPQDINRDGVSEWYEKLLLYIDNPKILRVNADTTDPRRRPCSFVSNSWFDYVIPESMVRDPSDTIYLTEREIGYAYDFIEWWRWQEGTWPPDPANIPTDDARHSIAIERYTGLNNYLYVDAHVRARAFEATWHPRVTWWPEAPMDAPTGDRM